MKGNSKTSNGPEKSIATKESVELSAQLKVSSVD
jgi:hypothetical protein